MLDVVIELGGSLVRGPVEKRLTPDLEEGGENQGKKVLGGTRKGVSKTEEEYDDAYLRERGSSSVPFNCEPRKIKRERTKVQKIDDPEQGQATPGLLQRRGDWRITPSEQGGGWGRETQSRGRAQAPRKISKGGGKTPCHW